MKEGAELRIEGPRGKSAVDVARARYGDADTACEAGESSAVLALLRGTYLKQVKVHVFSCINSFGFSNMRHTITSFQAVEHGIEEFRSRTNAILSDFAYGLGRLCLGIFATRFTAQCDLRRSSCA